MEFPLLKNIVFVFGMAIVMLLICNRLKLPTIVGLLLTGILTGPHGLGFITETAEIDMLATIGIMLLLFTIGLEFSLKRLMHIKKYFFIGGILQVGLTTVCGFIIAKFIGRPFGESMFLGFLLSMSSTAIVLKALEAQHTTDSPQGRVCLGILIFQDVIAIPMIVLTPLLGDSKQAFDASFALWLLGGIGVVCAVFLVAMKVIPTLLYYIARLRNRELFLLSVLTICFSVAWLAASMGLSLAIGAFLAGLIIAESEYRHEVVGNILPLQDIFSSLFFVSIGMLLDLGFVLEQPGKIFLITLGVIAMKSVVVGITAVCLGRPLRIVILSAIALSQVGEFSFVLANIGLDYGLGDEYRYELFLAVALLSMGLTPTLIALSNRIADLLMHLPLPTKWKSGLEHVQHTEGKRAFEDHVVIVGFGIAGRNLARAAKNANLSYAVIEMNAETVVGERIKGEPIFFGDASHESVLEHVNIKGAKAIAIMINDPNAAKRIVATTRKLNPIAYLIVRTRYLQEASLMYQLGATEVVPDEIGTSVEMFTRVLNHYDVAQEHIDDFATKMRLEGYQIAR
jgi:CPA2 family monovalent cation:H+ antiporter-2